METRHRKRRLITDPGMVSDPSSELQPTLRQPSIAPFPLGSRNAKDSSYNDMAGGKYYSTKIQTKEWNIAKKYLRFKMTVNKWDFIITATSHDNLKNPHDHDSPPYNDTIADLQNQEHPQSAMEGGYSLITDAS